MVIVLLFVTSNSFALNYTINFTGSGASTTVDSVVVQNLTKGTTVTVPTGKALVIGALTSINQVTEENANIQISQNATDGKTTASFLVKQAGITQLSVFSLDGRKVVTTSQYLQQGTAAFEITLPKGVFVLQITGNGYNASAKIVNQTAILNNPTIAFVENTTPLTTPLQKSNSETNGATTMAYTAGDQLLFKGISGNYSTIVTDVPTADKIINFDFVPCQDADGNNYTVVTIGTQTWMAENLKTTKYCTGDSIGTTYPTTKNIYSEETPRYQWAYDGNERYVAKYGRFYTWYAATDSRNIAPVGWHVPTDAEWTTLENYVSTHLGASRSVAKALASTTDWIDYTGNAVGCNLTLNNSSGFGALPGTYRYDGGGTNYYIRLYGFWWSSTEYGTDIAFYRSILYNTSYVYRDVHTKKVGYSVRCVKD